MVHHASDLPGSPSSVTRYATVCERAASTSRDTGVEELPTDLGMEAEAKAQATMVGYCESSTATSWVSPVPVGGGGPEVAEEAEAKRQERELRDADGRHLNFSHDGHGSTTIKAVFLPQMRP